MIFKEWKPINDASGHFYLQRLEDNTTELTILLQSENNNRIMRLIFDSFLCYHNIDEGDLLKSLQQGEIKEGFFIITDSSYLKWFHEQSLGIREDENICHYAIYTPNDTIDILARSAPKVEWIN